MKTEIIVVGAGHGGLTAAAKLAKNGFKVKIFEKNNLDDLSWDWGDAFVPDVFDRIGMPMPDASLYSRHGSSKFSCPNEKNQLNIITPSEKQNIFMERRVLAKLLVDRALDAGVEINFNVKITKPLIKESKIIGISSKDLEINGELIIDSAGIHTPIREQLPENYGFSHNFKRGEYFYTYRGYFDKPVEDPYYHIYLCYKYKRGIAWVNTFEEHADVLLGCIDPFKEGEIEALTEDLRSKHPTIGKNLLRGGQVALIPIRRTAPLIVGKNYALVGDAAFMTVPLIGSGIAYSMIAGDILADTVISANENYNGIYDASTLWPYQRQYYEEIGGDTAFIEIIKDFLLCVDDFSDLDFLFEKRILKSTDVESATGGAEFKLKFFDLMGRAYRGRNRIGLLLDLSKKLRNGAKAKKHFQNIPKQYDKNKISKWIEKGERFYEPFYTKLATDLLGK